MARQTAQLQLTFQINFEHDAPEALRMQAAIDLAHDLMEGIRSECRSSEDRLRFKATERPRVMFVTQDDGGSFL